MTEVELKRLTYSQAHNDLGQFWKDKGIPVILFTGQTTGQAFRSHKLVKAGPLLHQTFHSWSTFL